MYIHLQNKMCKELEALEEKYRSGAEMSEGDLRRIDLLTHSMKSLATYVAMKEAEDYRAQQNGEYSHAPNGAYVSGNNSYMDRSYMDRSYNNNSYNNSYGGPQEDMRRNMPYYPENRRW